MMVANEYLVNRKGYRYLVVVVRERPSKARDNTKTLMVLQYDRKLIYQCCLQDNSTLRGVTNR